ncbi:MAG: universal stress protein [Chromatiaceae bacterium]|nr:universal stress protein [Chromatiaceae bacterium]
MSDGSMGPIVTPASQNPILAAVDLSERSELCLAHGCKMARKLERPLVVAHIVHETAENAGMYRRHHGKRDTTPLHDIACSMLEERVAAFRSSGMGLHDECEIRLVVVGGIPATRILELAARYDATMILMCSHARRGLSRWLHGSVTESVMRRATCPVVVVGQGNGGLSALDLHRSEAQGSAALQGV